MEKAIQELEQEAAAAGDQEMVALCLRALAGDGDAMAECVSTIIATRMRAEEG